MRAPLSVRWRLLLAFLGISAFAVLAVGGGHLRVSALWRMCFERITEQRVPSAFTALQLSRQAERIVTAAPSPADRSLKRKQHREVSAAITTEVNRLEALLGQVKGGVVEAAALAALEPSGSRGFAAISPRSTGPSRGRLEVSGRSGTKF